MAAFSKRDLGAFKGARAFKWCALIHRDKRAKSRRRRRVRSTITATARPGAPKAERRTPHAAHIRTHTHPHEHAVDRQGFFDCCVKMSLLLHLVPPPGPGLPHKVLPPPYCSVPLPTHTLSKVLTMMRARAYRKVAKRLRQDLFLGPIVKPLPFLTHTPSLSIKGKPPNPRRKSLG